MMINMNLFSILLMALMGVPGLVAKVQISWDGKVTAGFSTTFTCSSSCFPNCIYSWVLKGRTIKGSTLTWTPDGQENTVDLLCTVLTSETVVFSSAISVVEIKNRLSVQVSPTNTVPSFKQALDLVCHLAKSGDFQGPSNPIWFKDGQKVTPSDKMQLLQNNLTLHFDTPLPSDAGFYQCEASLQETRVLSLGYLLSFDPWNITISGPDIVFPGRLYEFKCLTSCTLNLDCTVKWQFKHFPTGTYFSVSGNVLKWIPSIPGTFQNFTCIAENEAAGRSAQNTKMVEVKGSPQSGSQAAQLGGLLTMIHSLGLLMLFD
ncbi:Carcinoembryonic antigen-related cell adhesion molecule 20 Precursor [Channa argus]|uniref:Carcinoembryonic antigen-related cell adhesion molecule 20 n=1 Tax=Channa argus TaxID=215402 RepID=A0A6G1PP50_CHAAH|nr:Carcinoembryonic antigen-related cell adhesion molecule 20 Precursor [Channa argus]